MKVSKRIVGIKCRSKDKHPCFTFMSSKIRRCTKTLVPIMPNINTIQLLPGIVPSLLFAWGIWGKLRSILIFSFIMDFCFKIRFSPMWKAISSKTLQTGGPIFSKWSKPIMKCIKDICLDGDLRVRGSLWCLCSWWDWLCWGPHW